MSQLQLPIFPSEAINLSQHIGVVKKYVYFSNNKSLRIQQMSIRKGNIHKYDDKTLKKNPKYS